MSTTAPHPADRTGTTAEPPTGAGWNPAAADCPSRRLFTTLGDRWNMLILLSLETGPLRYRDLRGHVDGISEKVLSGRLATLVGDGLLTRTSYPEIPPRVVYELSALGRSALLPVHELFDWTVAHMTEVAAHQAHPAA
jgi:DNA-binding HxlR family transcriptional regulator